MHKKAKMKCVFKLDGWSRKVYRFENGYGISIYVSDMKAHQEKPYSICPIKFTDDTDKNWEVLYRHPIMKEVNGASHIFGNERYSKEEYLKAIELISNM